MDDITDGLMSIHAFTEQYRFVKGGEENLPTEFWSRNENDLARVKSTLSYLLHGPGEFVERLHDILYDPARNSVYSPISAPLNFTVQSTLRNALP